MEWYWWVLACVLGVFYLGLFLSHRKYTYYSGDLPYLKVAMGASKEFLRDLKKVLKKGPSAGIDDNLLEAVVTSRGDTVARVWFFPEGLSVLRPVEFLAKMSGIDPEEVKVFGGSGKLVLSGGKYAIVLEKPEEDNFCKDRFAEGFLTGSLLR